ncbi:Protein kinase kin1 [Porphyridium purpureum]|uniref:Protein kinase kin1 n=1 Tax=Porphyridium purpureum TaxID=35688 RepID=A0A5J4YL62_PORPP|nr:Protein kinase kin1 [Porphyridium purpureum]|eukprot:POR9743..scf246_12
MGQYLSSENGGPPAHGLDMHTLVADVLMSTSSFSRTHTERTLQSIGAANAANAASGKGGSGSGAIAAAAAAAGAAVGKVAEKRDALGAMASAAQPMSAGVSKKERPGAALLSWLKNPTQLRQDRERDGSGSSGSSTSSKMGPFLPVSIPTLYVTDQNKDGRLSPDEISRALKRWAGYRAAARGTYAALPEWQRRILEESVQVLASKKENGVLTLFAVRRVLKDIRSCTVWCAKDELHGGRDSAYIKRTRGGTKDVLAVEWSDAGAQLQPLEDGLQYLDGLERTESKAKASTNPIPAAVIEEYAVSALAAEALIKDDHSALVRALESGGRAERKRFVKWLWFLAIETSQLPSSEHAAPAGDLTSVGSANSSFSSSSKLRLKFAGLSMGGPSPAGRGGVAGTATDGVATLESICQLLQLMHEDCISLDTLPIMMNEYSPGYSNGMAAPDAAVQEEFQLHYMDAPSRQGSAFFESLFRNEIDPLTLFEDTARRVIRSLRSATHSSSVLNANTTQYAAHDQDGLLDLGTEHEVFADYLLEKAGAMRRDRSIPSSGPSRSLSSGSPQVKGTHTRAMTALSGSKEAPDAQSSIHEQQQQQQQRELLKQEVQDACSLDACVVSKSMDSLNLSAPRLQEGDGRFLAPDEMSLPEFFALGDLVCRLYLVRPLGQMPECGWYELRRELGTGAQGTVYLGRDISTSQMVAVKTIGRVDAHENYDHVLMRNPLVTGVLDILEAVQAHPSIVRYKKVIATDDACHFVMDMCAGGSLFEVLTYLQSMTPEIEAMAALANRDRDTAAYGSGGAASALTHGSQRFSPSGRKSLDRYSVERNSLDAARRSSLEMITGRARGRRDSNAILNGGASSSGNTVPSSGGLKGGPDTSFQLSNVVEGPLVSERTARCIFRQLASAVAHCHRHNVCHRDLRLHNLMLTATGDLILIDFDSASAFSGGWDLFSGEHLVGSLYYQAPEQVNGTAYAGMKVDVWAMGIILYWLFYGRPPFAGDSMLDTFALIRECTWDPKLVPSPLALDLLKKLINKDPQARLTAEQVCEHPWLKVDDDDIDFEDGTNGANADNGLSGAFESRGIGDRNHAADLRLGVAENPLEPLLSRFCLNVPVELFGGSIGPGGDYDAEAVFSLARKVLASIWADADKFFLVHEHRVSTSLDADPAHSVVHQPHRSLTMQVAFPEFEFCMLVNFVWLDQEQWAAVRARVSRVGSVEGKSCSKGSMAAPAPLPLPSRDILVLASVGTPAKCASEDIALMGSSPVESMSFGSLARSIHASAGHSPMQPCLTFDLLRGGGNVFVKASRKIAHIFLQRVHAAAHARYSLSYPSRKSISQAGARLLSPRTSGVFTGRKSISGLSGRLASEKSRDKAARAAVVAAATAAAAEEAALSNERENIGRPRASKEKLISPKDSGADREANALRAPQPIPRKLTFSLEDDELGPSTPAEEAAKSSSAKFKSLSWLSEKLKKPAGK